MLVIHPDSSCDICLEQFETDSQCRAPHAPRCGHVFCLRCLQSLGRRVCPMCRNPFQPSEVTRIHLDQRSSSCASGSTTPPSPTANFPDPSSTLARELHDRINAFVSTGASTSVAHSLTDDCKSFFQDHPPTSHLDFYVTYQLLNHFLLGYYRAFFQDPAAADKSLQKFQTEVQAYHQSWENRYRRLTRNIDDLAEKLRLEVLAKENEMHERQTAEAVVQSLKDELQAQESWWHWKYDELQGKYDDLQGEVLDLRGEQIRVMVAQCQDPHCSIQKTADSPFQDMKENELQSPVIPPFQTTLSPKKGSPLLLTYDYTTSLESCLSIISTPRVDDCSLRDESEMKEILSDLLTDPISPPRRVRKHINYGSPSPLRIPSGKHVSSSSDFSHHESPLSSTLPNSLNTAPMSAADVSSTATAATMSATSLPTAFPDSRSSSQAASFPPAPSEPPLWSRKRSLRPMPYTRDSKGKAAFVSRNLSVGESE